MVVAKGTMAEGGESGSAATPLTFQNFLEKMRHPSASELVKSVKSFISSFGSGGVVDAEADSARIQEFLATTEGAFRGHPAWRGASDDELDASGEGLEKYLMTKLHPSTFAVTGDDKRADEHLARRVAALRTFIRPEHLDIPAHFRVETSWRLAEDELAKVNHFKAPRDKLVCVLNTCRIVNNLLNTAGGNKPAGADDFLPVLIYVVLRANPPFLESNLRYVARFRRESRLRSEAAYFYTNLVSAASFLATCDHAAFTNLDADVFEAHMLAEGVDPKRTPDDIEIDEEARAREPAAEREARGEGPTRASRMKAPPASTSSEAAAEPLRRDNARARRARDRETFARGEYRVSGSHPRQVALGGRRGSGGRREPRGGGRARGGGAFAVQVCVRARRRLADWRRARAPGGLQEPGAAVRGAHERRRGAARGTGVWR